MKEANRFKKCEQAANQLKDLIDISTIGKGKNHYTTQLTILLNNLRYLSIEKKKHRLNFLMKVLHKKLTFRGRLVIAFKFLFLNNTLEGLNEEKIHYITQQKQTRDFHKKAA